MKMVKTKHDKKDRWAEYARFGATGVLNTAVDFLTFNLLILASGPVIQTKAHATFKAAAFIVAVANSYMLNRHWVFRRAETARGKGSRLGEGGRFLAVSIAGFFVNVAVSTLAFYLLAERGSLMGPHAAANIGAALGTLLTLISNYVGYRYFVFKKQNTHEVHKEHPALGHHTGLQRIETNTQDAR